MAAEQKLTRDLRLDIARAEAETRFIEAEIESKRRIERLKVSGFQEDARREREVKERIRSMKIEAARREAEEAVSPIKEGLAQITARICEALRKCRCASRMPSSCPAVLQNVLARCANGTA